MGIFALVMGLLSALLYGLADFVGGCLTMRRSARMVVAGGHGVGLAILLGWVIAFNPAFQGRGIGIGLAVGCLSAVSLTSLFALLSTGASISVAPTVAAISAVTVLGWRSWLGLLGLGSLVGVVLALVGLVLVDWRGADRVTLVRRCAVPGIASGVALILLSTLRPQEMVAALSMERVATVVVLLGRGVFPRSRRPSPKFSSTEVFGFVALGLGYIFATAAFVRGARSELVVCVVAASQYPVVTVLASIRWRRERILRLQLAGLLVTALGLAWMTLGP